VKLAARSGRSSRARSAFAGFRFPVEVIVVAVRWYLRYGLSYRYVEELLAERGVEVDHVTVYRWVQRFTPLLADAARFARHAPGDRWFVDETYVKVNGVWRYVYRAVDQHGQVIDVLLSARRDAQAARRFFTRALRTLKVMPSEVVTDAAPVYPGVLDELLPAAWHHVERYANNPIEADHSELKHRLRPMRALRTDDTAAVVIAGHAFAQIARQSGKTKAAHARRDAAAARRFLTARCARLKVIPSEVVTDAAPVYPGVLAEQDLPQQLVCQRSTHGPHRHRAGAATRAQSRTSAPRTGFATRVRGRVRSGRDAGSVGRRDRRSPRGRSDGSVTGASA
jgi:transposase-like protein